MSAERPPPERVPTLTEVIELDLGDLPTAVPPSPDQVLGAQDDLAGFPVPSLADEPIPGADIAAGSPTVTPAPPRSDAAVEELLAAVEARIDALLEARLRAALAPALARAADVLIREARDEVARELRALATEAVARERDRRQSH